MCALKNIFVMDASYLIKVISTKQLSKQEFCYKQ